MRFSDLKKAQNEIPAPQPKKPAPVSAAPAAPRPETQAAQPPAPATPPAKERRTELPQPRTDEDRAEAIQKGAGAFRPRVKGEPRPAAAPSAPYRDLLARAREVYARLLDQTGSLLRGADQPYTEKYEACTAAATLASETLKENPVLLTCACHSTAEDYLHGHSANVTVVALAMGRELNLPESELRLLGFCAMAHDIGMTGYSALYNSESRLTEEQFSEITAHPEAGAQKLDRIVDLDYKIKDRAKKIIMQSHERIDGSGYPARLAGEEIDPLALIIGLADVYEAMTHPRPWRGPFNPPDVVKELIEKEGLGFSSRTVKALISAVTIYPPGSLVELSTGETARVIKVNPGSLTRPLVEIIADQDFNALPPAAADLLEHPLTSVERPLGPGELEEHNPRLAAKLELEGWWVQW